MKYIAYILIFLLLISCKSSLVNYALKQKGIYDDKITLNKFKKEDSEIVFFQMAHIGTDLFYNDVKQKVDSLIKYNYHFYFELINSDNSDDTLIRKSIKITEIPFQKQGYMSSLDSIFKKNNVKLRKTLISQPDYNLLGLTDFNSVNVDLSLKEIVDYYEQKYHPIILESCDFEVSKYEKPKCPIKLTKEVRDDIILNSRNNHVLQEIAKEKTNKIAIIYGKGHFKGIREGLIKMGYKEIIN